jgi:hypothetical protein
LPVLIGASQKCRFDPIPGASKGGGGGTIGSMCFWDYFKGSILLRGS